MKEREEVRQKLDREERERFFNLPHAKTDYDHWSKAAHWTLDEALALSFGRAPEIVRWDQLQKFSSLGSPFVAQYARRRDLALRALTWKQLFDPVLPGIFLAWAKRTDIAVPSELTEAVQKRGVQVAEPQQRTAGDSRRFGKAQHIPGRGHSPEVAQASGRILAGRLIDVRSLG